MGSQYDDRPRTEAMDDVLQGLRRDPRFRGLLGAKTVTLDLYLLRLRRGGDELPPRLLYGWVVPSARWREGWQARSLSNKYRPTEVEGIKYRIATARVALDTSTMLAVLRSWASESLGAAVARHGDAAPESIEQLSLDDNFAIAPIVALLRTEPTLAEFVTVLRGSTSPDDDASGWALCFVRVDKPSLFAWQGQPFSSQVARTALETIGRETRLRFFDNDAARLGSLELLTLRSESGGRKPLELRMGSDAASAVVDTQSLETGTTVFVDLRGDVSQEILSSSLSSQVVAEPGTPLVFRLEGEFNGLSARVWAADPSDPEHPWLLSEHRGMVIEQVGAEMGLASHTGTISSPWLQDLERGTKHPKVAKRAKALQQFSRVSHQPMGVDIRGPLSRMRMEARQFANSLRTQPHDSWFFPKGWKREAGPGRLAFFEWFKQRVGSTRARRMVFVDPYFDAPGLEVFVRASRTETLFTVLTCTQTESDDDMEGQPPRAERLQEAAQCNRSALAGLAFEIIDLQSSQGRKRLFHDRYFIEFDAAGSAVGGYHLSNSIQGATKTEALLITSIGGKALEQVGSYVLELLQGRTDPSSRASVVKLFETRGHRPRLSDKPPRLLRHLWWLVFGDPNVLFVDADPSVAYLAEHGVVRRKGGGTSYAASMQAWAAIVAARAELTASPHASELFVALAWVCAHLLVADPPRYIQSKDLALDPPPGWLEAVSTAVATTLERDISLTASGPSVDPEIAQDFARALPEAYRIRRYSHAHGGRPWAVTLGLDLLLTADSSHVSQLVLAWLREFAQGRLEAAWVSRALQRVVDAIVVASRERLQDLVPLMASPVPLLRAFGALAAVHSPRTQAEVNIDIAALTPGERRQALAIRVRDIRIYDGALEGRATRLREALAALEQQLPDDIELAELCQLLDRADGNIEGIEILELHDHVLAPFSRRSEKTERTVLRLEVDLCMARALGVCPFGARPSPQPREYYDPVDMPLSLVGGIALAQLSADDFAIWRKVATSESSWFRFSITRPFSSTIDYSAYRDARNCLARLAVLVSTATAAGRPPEDFEWWDELVTDIDPFDLPAWEADVLRELPDDLRAIVQQLAVTPD